MLPWIAVVVVLAGSAYLFLVWTSFCFAPFSSVRGRIGVEGERGGGGLWGLGGLGSGEDGEKSY